LLIENVNKFMGRGASYAHVLKDISLGVNRGEFIAIIGQSGSGKSTLLNMLGCLDKPTFGSYLVSGIDTSTLNARQLSHLRSRTFGFVFQRYNLLTYCSSLENVLLPAVYTGMSPKERRERATKLLQQFGLADRLRSKPNELSGGQQQRVSIARALMNGGEILLADEPTGALDTHSGKIVMEAFNTLNTIGHTIILVTHNSKIAEHAHRVIEIQDGRIVSDRKKLALIHTVRFESTVNTYAEISRLDLFVEALKMAVQSIFSHKLRSVLTMLGIVFGIAAVISVIALGRGSQEMIISDIHAMGTNTIDILPGKGFGDMQSQRIKTLNIGDVDALKNKTYVIGATPKANSSGVVVYNGVAVNSFVYGVGEQYFFVKGIEPANGRFISLEDVSSINSVAVIDQKMKKSLCCSGESPVGKIIIFNKRPFRVIGVTKETQRRSNDESNPEIFIPYSTLMYRITGDRSVDSIIVRIRNDINAQAAENDMTKTLINRHNNVHDFFTFNTDSIKKTVEKANGTMTALIFCIGVISLVVGGIGVMNIMLVSVTERISEIGIRMAIGARQVDILAQFLIESTVICSLGGVLGIVLSFLIRPILSILSTEIRLIYSLDSFILALCFSSFIGILFGFLPARNASRLSPIDALGRD